VGNGAACGTFLARAICVNVDPLVISRACSELVDHGLVDGYPTGSAEILAYEIPDLERYVAAPLFFRASSGVKLTQEGEDLQRSAGDMMLAFESFSTRSAFAGRAAIVSSPDIGDRRHDQALAAASR